MSEVVVTFKHLRELNFCAPGIKRWCIKNGLEFKRFRSGVPASELRATGCSFAIKAADLAEAKGKL